MKISAKDIFPLHDEGFLDRGQIKRGDIPKLLPRPDTWGLSKEVCREIARLNRHGQILRYDDFTFPRVKLGLAMRNHKLPVEKQQGLESLRSLYNGSWVCAPDCLERVERRILSSL